MNKHHLLPDIQSLDSSALLFTANYITARSMLVARERDIRTHRGSGGPNRRCGGYIQGHDPDPYEGSRKAIHHRKRASQAIRHIEGPIDALKTNYESLRDAVTGQIEDLKTELIATISTQLSSVYVLVSASALASYGMYAAVACSRPLSQPSNLASISMSRALAILEALSCTIDISKALENRQDEIQVGPVWGVIEKEV
jgi:hypothetical protein